MLRNLFSFVRWDLAIIVMIGGYGYCGQVTFLPLEVAMSEFAMELLLCAIALLVGCLFAIYNNDRDDECWDEGMAMESSEFRACFLSRDSETTSICDCLDRAKALEEPGR